MRTRLTRAAALLLMLAVAAGCGVPTQASARLIPDQKVPAGLLSASTSTTTTTQAPAPTIQVTLCLAHNSGRLRSVERQVPPGATVDALLLLLAQPPTAREQAGGLSTVLTAGITGTVSGGIATVVLSNGFTRDTTADQLTAVAQIVCTLTTCPGIGQVQFKLHHTNIAVPRGNGSTTSKPVSRDDYRRLMPLSTTT